MDPNEFYLDFIRVSEAIAIIVVIAMMLERSLSVPFENRWFMEKVLYRIKRAKDMPGFNPDSDEAPDRVIQAEPRFGAAKELITIAVSFAVCRYWGIDAFSFIMPVMHPEVTLFGEFLTALAIAGGSKGAIRLFNDWLAFKSRAANEIDVVRERQRTKGKKAKA